MRLAHTELIIAFFLTVVLTFNASAGTLKPAPETQMFSPLNDTFKNALEIEASNVLFPGNLYFATRESGETKTSAKARGKSVWFKYTARASGKSGVVLTTFNFSTAPFEMAVYSGNTLASLRLIDTLADTSAANSLTSGIVFSATKGRTYYIQVDTSGQPTDSFGGDFVLGLAEFGSTGGIALFRKQPLIIRDGSTDRNQRSILAFNGYSTRVRAVVSLATIGTDLTVTPVSTSIAAGGTAWFNIGDDGDPDLSDVGTTKGTLRLAAVDPDTNVTKDTSTEAIYGYQPDQSSRSMVQVRFHDAGQGARVNSFITSEVSVKNASTAKVVSCHFYAGNDAYALSFSEILSNGNSANTNAPFDLTKGQVRRFKVSFTTLRANFVKFIKVACGNTAGNQETFGIANLTLYEQLGAHSAVTIDFNNISTHMQYKVADYGSKVIVARIKNTGDYTGYFTAKLNKSYASRAIIFNYICLSNSSGTCRGAREESTVEFDLAEDESQYLAISVTRNTETESGFGFLNIRSIESPFVRDAAFSGFEVTE